MARPTLEQAPSALTKLKEKIKLLERAVADLEPGVEQARQEYESRRIVFDRLAELEAEIDEEHKKKAELEARLLVLQAESLELDQKWRKVEKRAAAGTKLKAALADGDPVQFKAALVELGARNV